MSGENISSKNSQKWTHLSTNEVADWLPDNKIYDEPLPPLPMLIRQRIRTAFQNGKMSKQI